MLSDPANSVRNAPGSTIVMDVERFDFVPERRA
jgi:hypothetical protein